MQQEPSDAYVSTPRVLPDMFAEWMGKPVRLMGKVCALTVFYRPVLLATSCR